MRGVVRPDPIAIAEEAEKFVAPDTVWHDKEYPPTRGPHTAALRINIAPGRSKYVIKAFRKHATARMCFHPREHDITVLSSDQKFNLWPVTQKTTPVCDPLIPVAPSAPKSPFDEAGHRLPAWYYEENHGANISYACQGGLPPVDMAYNTTGDDLYFVTHAGLSYVRMPEYPRLKAFCGRRNVTKPYCLAVPSLHLTGRRQTVVTGGMNGDLWLWEKTDDQGDYLRMEMVPEKLPSQHTEGFPIESATSHYLRPTIFTGSSDGLLHSIDLQKRRVLDKHKFENRIIGLEVNPMCGNLLLVSQATLKDNLFVLDDRLNHTRPVFVYTGFCCNDSMDIRGHWSPDSFMVACGSTRHIMNVWDVRYTRGDSGKVAPTELETTHNEVLGLPEVHFHPAKKSMLVSVGIDATIGIHRCDRFLR